MEGLEKFREAFEDYSFSFVKEDIYMTLFHCFRAFLGLLISALEKLNDIKSSHF